MPITGADFETLVEPYFRVVFEEMDFFVLQVRKQTSGSQDGFDISVLFTDDNLKERHLFIECKYYTTAQLNWADIFSKQVQLSASNHDPTAFILLSPLRNLSNIDHNIQAKFVKSAKFPVDFWTPDMEVGKMLALDLPLYKKVFDTNTCDIIIARDVEIQRLKIRVNILIQKKDALKYADIIRINESTANPDEDAQLKTTLDEKLNSILSQDDERRIEFHRIRANYKVFIEELSDLNSELRSNILAWESDLRLKADRLTNQFKIDSNYSAEKFFYDFFDIAEKDMLTFYKDFGLKGDQNKLLHGVIFELAAQCPLDWRKDG